MAVENPLSLHCRTKEGECLSFVATVVSSVDPLSPCGIAAAPAVASSGHMTAPTFCYHPEHPYHPAACLVPPLPAGIDPADFQMASKANTMTTTTNGLLAVESILLSSSHVYGQQQVHQEDMLASMAAAAAAAGINVDLGQQLASAAVMDQHHAAGKVMGGEGGGGCGPQSPKYISL